MNQSDVELKKKKAEREAFLKTLDPITFAELEETVRKWILVADEGIVKLLCAIVVANKLSRDPIWIYLIAPSGGGKSELLQSLFDIPEIYPISLLTPNTFLSGMPGAKDTSLLPRLDGKIMAFLDWTNISSMNKEAFNEIMGQLRDIYGGRVVKVFGTGAIREWRGKVGLIAATTSAVDFGQQRNAPLGERFIHYRIRMPDPQEAARRAFANGDKQTEMRDALRTAFAAFMKHMEKMPVKIPEIPGDVEEEIIQLASFAVKARSGVFRDFGPKREVMFVPAAEMPTRLTQQLKTLAVSMIIVNNGAGYQEKDMQAIYKVALDSIPETHYMVMKEMARGDEQATSDIATAVGYPSTTIRMYLENLALLGLCTRIKGKDSEEGGSADRWTLHKPYVEILKRYDTIRALDVEFAPIAEALPPLDEEPPQENITGLL